MMDTAPSASKSLMLNCQTVDDAKNFFGAVFSVQVPSTFSVDQLKKAVKAENAPDLDHLAANKLILWKLTDPLPRGRTKAEENEFDRKIKAIEFPDPKSDDALGGDGTVQVLHPLGELSEYWENLPERKCLHLIVQIPHRSAHILVRVPPEDEAGHNRTNKRYREEASKTLQHLRAKKMKTHLPPLRDISAILDWPLEETEKIAISHETYADLITPLHERTDTCNEEDLSILFKKSDTDVHSPLDVLYTAVVTSPAAKGTEEYFRGFWDQNIKNVVELVLEQVESIRNSNRNTETKKYHPDFGLLVQDVCIFRGEEKGPQNTEDPRTELSEKLTWVYHSAEYLLGYYCRGFNLTLVAICPPSSPGGKPIIHDLGSTNLRLRRDRIINIRRLINMSTFLRPLSDIVQSARGEFQPMKRDFATVEITASCIIKTYTCEDADARVEHLENIYASLLHHMVPNTDRILYIKDKAAYLAPRGIPCPPKVQMDLRECILCVLDTLVVLHKIPIFHRDIRWPNIIRNANNPRSWILIDWEDAGKPPTFGQPRFNLSDHSRRILEDNHGAEVDIWAIGHLIISCGATDLSSEFNDLGRRICQEAQILTAQDVLKLVRSLP